MAIKTAKAAPMKNRGDFHQAPDCPFMGGAGEGSPEAVGYGEKKIAGKRVVSTPVSGTLTFSPSPTRGGVRAPEIPPDLEGQGQQGGKGQGDKDHLASVPVRYFGLFFKAGAILHGNKLCIVNALLIG